MLTDKERDAVTKIIEFEDELPPTAFNLQEGGEYPNGWSWRDVHVQPAILNNLVIKGCLETVFKSNTYTGYRLTNEARVFLEATAPEPNQMKYNAKLRIPTDLFDVIEGYGEIKALFNKSLLGEPVDFLMIGTPGSAKTMFLSELERIGGATPIVLGGTASKVGVIDVLFDYRPTLLLLDEFEHMNTKDYTVLLSLCETRIISETKHGKTRRLSLPNTRVFAGCNTTKYIPLAVLDRLQMVRFKSYTWEEFRQVIVNVLTTRMNVDKEVAEYIAEKTWDFSHSVRQAMRIAKMATTKEEVDNLIFILRKFAP